MGQLIFKRLYLSHMTGDLDAFKENKMRLYPYLEGFAEWRVAYSRYPNALLALHFICGVGQKIMATLFVNARDSTEGEEKVSCESENKSCGRNRMDR